MLYIFYIPKLFILFLNRYDKLKGYFYPSTDRRLYNIVLSVIVETCLVIESTHLRPNKKCLTFSKNYNAKFGINPIFYANVFVAFALKHSSQISS